jgi:DNA-binding transcriptional LysR family regulator
MPAGQIAPVLADLHLLTVVAQTRSFTQAARRLGVSKASVSMRISDLERAAGVPLVRRTTRSVGLTQAGLQLVDDTQASFTRIPRDSPKLPRIVESIPVKRLGMPEDVARAVLFFAAAEADFITGQTLFVCGGTSVGSIVY